MNERIQKLYDLYSQNGLISTTDLNTFASATPEQQQKLYDLGVSKGLFKTVDFATFSTAFTPKKKDEAVPPAEETTPSPKPAGTASPSAVGSSEQPTPPSPKPIEEFKGFSQEQLFGLQKSAKEAPEVARIESEVNIPKREKILKEADREFSAFKAATSSEEDFASSLGKVNKELIDFDEDYIAPQLNYMFGNYGFKFEQALPGQEAIEVVAPNGKRKVISVDTFSDKKDLESSNELKAFIEQNKPKIVSMANQYSQYERKFNSEEEVAKSFKMINEEANALAQEQRSVAERYAAVQKEMEYLSTPAAKLSPDYAERLAKFNTDSQEVNSSIKQLSAKESDVIVKQRKLDKSVGMYTEMKSEQGGIFGAMYNAAVGSVGSSAAAKVSVFNDLVTAVIPLEYQMGEEAYRKSFIEKASANGISIPPTLSKENFNAWVDKLNEDVRDNIDSKILDENRKTLKNEMLPVVRTGLVEMIGDKGTTKEYIAKKQEEYIAGGLIGLGGSAPAIGLSIGAAPVGMAEFFFLGMDATMQQMSAPEFKDVSETEKYAVAVPVGIVNAVLEEFGFRNVIGKSGVVNNILTRTLNKSTRLPPLRHLRS